MRAADVEIDLSKMRARVDGRNVELTPTEFQLLATLARQPGRVFSRSQLLDAVRGTEVESFEREGKDGGVGLGLSLVKTIAEHHGGSVRYVPTQEGSRFEVRLPVDGPGSPVKGAGAGLPPSIPAVGSRMLQGPAKGSAN